MVRAELDSTRGTISKGRREERALAGHSDGHDLWSLVGTAIAEY